MKFAKKISGSNIVEYAMLALLVGVVFGYAIYNIKPDVYKNFFKSSFSNSTENSGNLTIGPISD
jgi:hypothetical protein